MERPGDSDPKKKFDDFIRYSSLGFEMATIIGGLTFLGYKIDQWMGNSFMAFTFAFSIISVVLAILYGIRNILKK